MPRFGSVCDDKVWRVPKLTRVSIVCRSCAWLTGAMIARSLRVRGRRRGGGADQHAGLPRANVYAFPTLLLPSPLAPPRRRMRVALSQPLALALSDSDLGGYFMRKSVAPCLLHLVRSSRVGGKRGPRTAIPPILTGAPSAAAIKARCDMVRRAQHGDADRARKLEGQARPRNDPRCIRRAQSSCSPTAAARRGFYRQVSRPPPAARPAKNAKSACRASRPSCRCRARSTNDLKAIPAPRRCARPSST